MPLVFNVSVESCGDWGDPLCLVSVLKGNEGGECVCWRRGGGPIGFEGDKPLPTMTLKLEFFVSILFRHLHGPMLPK